MKLTVPIGQLDDALLVADALDAAARTHRVAAQGGAAALEADRADGLDVSTGAAQVLALLATAERLERIGKAARSAHDVAAAGGAQTPAAATPPASPTGPAPLFMPPEPTPLPPPGPALTPAHFDPENDLYGIIG